MQRNRWAEAGCCLGVFCIALIVMNIGAAIGVNYYVFSTGPIPFPRNIPPVQQGVAVVVMTGRCAGLIVAVVASLASLLGFNYSNEMRTRRGRTQAGIGLGCSILYLLYVLFCPFEVDLSTGF